MFSIGNRDCDARFRPEATTKDAWRQRRYTRSVAHHLTKAIKAFKFKRLEGEQKPNSHPARASPAPLPEPDDRRMRLSTIKLSGFKSFVDPTTLHLPTNM